MGDNKFKSIADMIQDEEDRYIARTHGHRPTILALNELAYRMLTKYCSRISMADYKVAFGSPTTEIYMFEGMEIVIYKKQDEPDIVRIGVG